MLQLFLSSKSYEVHLNNLTNFETFFAQAPLINSNVSKITGVICGHRVEVIEDKLTQQIR